MGFTSFLVGVGAVIVVVGPKDLPIVARKLGYAVGRSVAFLRSARRVAREVSKDPEVAQMVAQVEKGVADIQTIRAEIQSLRSQRAIPYILANEEKKNEAMDNPEQRPLKPLPVMPPVSNKIFSPSHAEKLEVTGGADFIIESMQQSEIARSWKKD